MFKFFVVFTCVLLSPQCLSSPAEDSVVSVYTTLPTTAGTNPPLDVYHQIANNIAERITSPFFKILGYNVSTAAPTVVSPKHSENKIELSEEEDLTTKHEVKPIDNNIVKQRDVEELSTEGVTKPQKKPEKFTLYSSFASYLPARIQNNDTLKNEVDNDLDSLELDDVEMDDPGKPREGPFIYVLEFFGSIIQLLWGGFMNLFKPSDNSGSR